jgi:predicted enzyme related to lactoylglutathione lyase
MTHTITWFEVHGHDVAKLRGFYAELFGWKFKSEPNDPHQYATISPDQTGTGEASDGDGWVTVYVDVYDIETAIARAQHLGGALLRPTVDMPELSFAIIADPEGHAVGLLRKNN